MNCEIRDRAIVVFLDFDGVLHPANCRAAQLFSNLPRRQRALTEYPEVRIVVSSSWRQGRTLLWLRERLGGFGARVVGVTPTLPYQRDWPHRGFECTRWIAENAPHVPWLAIDDEPHLFSSNHRVVGCDPSLGFTDEASKEIQRHLTELRA